MAGDEYDKGITDGDELCEAFYFEYRDVCGNHTIIGRDYDSSNVVCLHNDDGPITLFQQFMKAAGFSSEITILVNGEEVTG